MLRSYGCFSDLFGSQLCEDLLVTLACLDCTDAHSSRCLVSTERILTRHACRSRQSSSASLYERKSNMMVDTETDDVSDKFSIFKKIYKTKETLGVIFILLVITFLCSYFKVSLRSLLSRRPFYLSLYCQSSASPAGASSQ